MRTRTRLVGALLGVLPLVFAGCELAAQGSPAQGTFERTLTVSGPVYLTVRTGSGAITIQPGASATTVRIVGHIDARGDLFTGLSAQDQVRQVQSSPPIRQEGNSIRIGDTLASGQLQHVGISYDVIVPAEAKIEATTGSGEQSIGAFKGPVTVTTGSGDLRVGQTGGLVRATTGSGNVEISGGEGGLDARTGSGNVVVRMPSSAGFTVNARTGSGAIDIARQMTVQGTISQHALRGTVGTGGPEVAVSTGSGDIRID